MLEKKKVWYIYCATGCSCCANENYYQGFWDNPDVPNTKINEWLAGKGNPLASQYARYGRYTLYETEVEILPDGRWIVDSEIFDANDVEFSGCCIWRD